MFKLEITKLDNSIEKIYNMNKKEDDFLQFIPKNYGVTKDEVKAFLFSDDLVFTIEAYLKLEGHALDLTDEGVIKVVKITTALNEITEVEEQTIEVIKTYQGQLIQWPYNPEGEFLGNGHELN